ncbi:calcium-binding protein, partial [Kushneria aurantia]|uniref:calcium-binding protein n=1 Tax=Kushneria aurantia TaxID=504092 RepID=UPI00146AD84D
GAAEGPNANSDFSVESIRFLQDNPGGVVIASATGRVSAVAGDGVQGYTLQGIEGYQTQDLEGEGLRAVDSNGQALFDIRLTPSNGTWDFVQYQQMADDTNITFTIGATDSDGDSASITQQIAIGAQQESAVAQSQAEDDGSAMAVSAASDNTIRGDAGDNTLRGSSGDDSLHGEAGNDTLIGGAGNDTLFGGIGADTFAWELGDQGGSDSPARDTVRDFNASGEDEGDKLDISSLLGNRDDDEDLSQYITATEEDGNTVLHVSSSGGLSGADNADQTIVMEGRSFDSFGGSQSGEDVIKHLLNNDQLKIDQ